MHLDPGDISDDFKGDPAQHTNEESPGTVADAEKELPNEEKTEKANVQGIAGEGGKILRVGKR